MSKISYQIYVLQKHCLKKSYLNTTSLTKPCFFISWSYPENCCLHLEQTQREEIRESLRHIWSILQGTGQKHQAHTRGIERSLMGISDRPLWLSQIINDSSCSGIVLAIIRPLLGLRYKLCPYYLLKLIISKQKIVFCLLELRKIVCNTIPQHIRGTSEASCLLW